MLARAKHEDLEECLRLLAVLLAEYRIKHGNISFDTAMDLVSREDFDEAQARLLGEGLEIIVGMLGFIEQGRRPQ
ncbi:hypothetical protein D3C85_1842890 [compost metagenome]